jgi:NAD-dependent SIR2 family protein deacetylase
MQTTTIKKSGNEYLEWQNTLGFYKDELGIFKKRLTEVAAKNTSKEIMQMVEHFQNQFLIQTENIDILHHDINAYQDAVAKEIQQHAGHVNTTQLASHDLLKKRFENEEKVFTGIKKEFAGFLSKVM